MQETTKVNDSIRNVITVHLAKLVWIEAINNQYYSSSQSSDKGIAVEQMAVENDVICAARSFSNWQNWDKRENGASIGSGAAGKTKTTVDIRTFI